MMKFIAFVSFIVFYSSCSPKLAPEGHFQDLPIIADGNVEDWGLPLRFSNAQHSFQYAVSTDKKNIYICIYSNDRNTEINMLKNGINIYLDPKGEKGKNTELQFPIRKPDQNNKGSRNTSTYTAPKITLDQWVSQSNYYNTKGFTNMENGQYSVTDSKSPIQVAIKNQDDGSLVYETIIPIRLIADFNPFAKKTAKNFGVGIMVNTGQTRYANNNYYSPQPYMGMRGMRMRGMYSPQPHTSQQTADPIEWYEFRMPYDKN